MINFFKHKGFTRNAKWLWLMGLNQLVGQEPSVERASHPMTLCDDLFVKTRLSPRRLLVSLAFAAPDDLSTEGISFLVSSL